MYNCQKTSVQILKASISINTHWVTVYSTALMPFILLHLPVRNLILDLPSPFTAMSSARLGRLCAEFHTYSNGLAQASQSSSCLNMHAKQPPHPTPPNPTKWAIKRSFSYRTHPYVSVASSPVPLQRAIINLRKTLGRGLMLFLLLSWKKKKKKTADGNEAGVGNINPSFPTGLMSDSSTVICSWNDAWQNHLRCVGGSLIWMHSTTWELLLQHGEKELGLHFKAWK